MKRIKELDVARYIAIFLMILVHAEYAIYNYGNTTFGNVVDYLGSPFAAPIFMFILGINIELSSHNTPRELFRRGIMTFVLSILFNVICHSLPFFILNVIDNSSAYNILAFHWIFAVDILTFSGLAFMFFAFVKKFNVKKYILVIIGLCLCVLNYYLYSNYQIDFESHYFLASFTSLFYNSSMTGYFSFFNWIIYPICGYYFIDFYKKYKDKDKFYLILGSISLFILAVMLLNQGNVVNGGAVINFEEEMSYYAMHPYGVVMTIVFCTAWISIIYFVSKLIKDKLYSHIVRVNKNLTIIYVLQWFIINYCFVLASDNKFFVNGLWLVLISIFIFIYSDMIAYLYKNYQGNEKYNVTRRRNEKKES